MNTRKLSVWKVIVEARRQGNLAPLHLIVWRMLWFLPYRACLALACLMCALCWGLYAAQKLWEAGT
jgi:hypothetical protein